MSSGAAQLPSHRGGRCRHRGAVMGCRAPHTRQPERGWAAQPAVAVVAVQGCPDAGHAVRRSVRVRCPPCGRTSVELVGRTSGVQATGVHATGVIRVSGQTCASGVRGRCSRAVRTALDPEYVGAADRPRLAHRVRRVAVGSASGMVVAAARIGPGEKGRSNVGRAWLARGSTPDLGRRLACVPAAAPRSPPGRPWELVPRQVPVGWRGSTGRSRCSQVPAGRAGQVAG
jgi:hypothetical protein